MICPVLPVSKLKFLFIFILFLSFLCYTMFSELLPKEYSLLPSLAYFKKKISTMDSIEEQGFQLTTSQRTMVEGDYIKIATQNVFNIPPNPFILGGVSGGPKYLQKSSCAIFPHVFRLKFDNTVWQTQKVSNWTFYLFGAYWDIRKLIITQDAPSIQILGMMDRTDENITTNYCQIWFHNQTEPLIAEISHYRYVWNKMWGNYKDGELQPYLMNCLMPQNYKGQIPTSVSVVPSPCTAATNNLRIHFDKPKRKETFAVCVKGMDFIESDWSIRLVEWIELLHLLGVSKIYFYNLAVHPNVYKLYNYYQERDKIQVFPLTHPGGLPNDPYLRHAYLKRKVTEKRQHELIPYNDCLYRNMYKYDYISLLDIDEIIIPHNGLSTWTQLAVFLESTVSNHETSNFIFGNVLFSGTNEKYERKERQNIPEYLYMLQHTTRKSQNEGPGSGIKCFLRPQNILTMHNHWPMACVPNCKAVFVNETYGFLHHYRTRGAGRILTKGNESFTFVVDETLWTWKDQLISRTNKVLSHLGLIP